jgi:hypothetical protein
MYNLGMGDILKPLAELAKPLDRAVQLVERLLGPPFEETGRVAGDLVGILAADPLHSYRERLQRNRRIVVEKADLILKGAGIIARRVPLTILQPVWDKAALEENEELRDRWAALLANAADPNSRTEIAPAFPAILAELSARDAKLLDAVFDFCANWRSLQNSPALAPDRISLGDAVAVYQGLYLRSRGMEPTVDGSVDPDLYREFLASFDNLMRLRLLKEDLDMRGAIEDFRRAIAIQQDQGSFDMNLQTLVGRFGRKEFYMTILGAAFVKACRVPE